MVATEKLGIHGKNDIPWIPYQFPLKAWYISSQPLWLCDYVHFWAIATSLLNYVQFKVAYTGKNGNVFEISKTCLF